MANDTLNTNRNILYCNHQVHRDFLITLYVPVCLNSTFLKHRSSAVRYFCDVTLYRSVSGCRLYERTSLLSPRKTGQYGTTNRRGKNRVTWFNISGDLNDHVIYICDTMFWKPRTFEMVMELTFFSGIFHQKSNLYIFLLHCAAWQKKAAWKWQMFDCTT
jgi:hypothetical protein